MHFSSSLKYIFITFYPFILLFQYGLFYLNNNQADIDEKRAFCTNVRFNEKLKQRFNLIPTRIKILLKRSIYSNLASY